MFAPPNHALEPTAASGLRPLAVPSALRASAAAQRERWASQETLAAELVLEANRTLTPEAIGNKGVIRDPLVLAA